MATGESENPLFDGNANCNGADVARFFPERGTAQITARDAKALCNGDVAGIAVCAKKAECLEYALGRKERFGIWGGKSERERAKIAKERRVAAKKRELEIEQSRQRRAAAARRGWENRRRKAVEEQEHKTTAKVVALGASKGNRATTQESTSRRRRSA